MHLPATQLQLNKIQIHYLAHLMWISVTIKILSHLDKILLPFCLVKTQLFKVRVYFQLLMQLTHYLIKMQKISNNHLFNQHYLILNHLINSQNLTYLLDKPIRLNQDLLYHNSNNRWLAKNNQIMTRILEGRIKEDFNNKIHLRPRLIYFKKAIVAFLMHQRPK